MGVGGRWGGVQLGLVELNAKDPGQSGALRATRVGAAGGARRDAGLGGMMAHALFAGQGGRGASGKEAYRTALRP